MRTTVYLIIAALVGSFGVATYFGVRHSRGTPVAKNDPVPVVLDAPFRDEDLQLASGVSLSPWDGLPATEVELMYQVTVLPWARSLVSPVVAKAFHNGKELFLYLSWNDESEDRAVGVNQFADAAAVMFPLGETIEPSTIMMGFMGRANLWHWKASRDQEYWQKVAPQSHAYSDFYYPFEEQELFGVSQEKPASAVAELLAERVGTVTPSPLQEVQGRGVWRDGRWHVVFRRSMSSGDPERAPALVPGNTYRIAFAVWNGRQGDRGGRKSISEWVDLRLEPGEPPVSNP